MEKPIDDVFQPNLLIKLSKRNEILNNLNLLHNKLSLVKQNISERPKGINEISKHLINPKYLRHSDKEIRLLICCCLADVLRIYAPEAPYDDREMVKIFSDIVVQLRGLVNYDVDTSIGEKLFYLLKSLSTVKSCVVPVILSQSGVEGAEDVVQDLFDCLISSMRVDTSNAVFEHCSSILQACIEESEEIHQGILDVLLSTLLPTSKSENPMAYRLSASILTRLIPNLHDSITNFVNNSLVGNTVDVNGKETDLSEHIYSIIYELHLIKPEMLLKIIPNLSIQLISEDEDLRLRAVQLLGMLFSSSSANYAKEYQRNFREYLGRFSDTSQTIRLQMIKTAREIFLTKPELFPTMEDSLRGRLRDPIPDLRHEVIQSLLTVGYHNPLQLSVQTFDELGERAKDRKSSIRFESLRGLCKLYRKHISSTFPPVNELYRNWYEPDRHPYEGSSDAVRHLVSEELWKRFQSVPSLLLRSWSYPDIANKHLIVQLLQEFILPPSIEISNRTDDSESDAKSDSDSSNKNLNDLSTIQDDPIHPTTRDKKRKASKASNDVNDSLAINLVRTTAMIFMYHCIQSDPKDVAILGTLLIFKSKVNPSPPSLTASSVVTMNAHPMQVREELQLFINCWKAFFSDLKSADSLHLKAIFRKSFQNVLDDENVSPIDLIGTQSYTSQDSGQLFEEPTSKSSEMFNKLQMCLSRILELVPSNDRKTEYFDKITAIKDQKVPRLLETALDIDLTIESAKEARLEISQRMDSKTSLSTHAVMLFDFAAHLVLNAEMTETLLTHLVTCNHKLLASSNDEDVKDSRESLYSHIIALARCCSTFAKYSPQSFSTSGLQLFDWLSSSLKALPSNSDTTFGVEMHPAKADKNQSIDLRMVIQIASQILSHSALDMIIKGFVSKEQDQKALKFKRMRKFSSSLSQSSCCQQLLNHLESTQDACVAEDLAETANSWFFISRKGLDIESDEGNVTEILSNYLMKFVPSSKLADATSVLSSAPTISTMNEREDRLSFNNPRLRIDLIILSKLLKIPTSAYRAINNRPELSLSNITWMRMMMNLKRLRKALSKFLLQKLLNHQSSSEDQPIELICQAIHAFSSLLTIEEELKQMAAISHFPLYSPPPDRHDRERDGKKQERTTGQTDLGSSSAIQFYAPSKEFEDLVAILFDCIESNGRIFANVEISHAIGSSESEMIYAAAAFNALSFVKLAHYHTLLSVPQWHRMGWTFLHKYPTDQTKKELVTQFCQLIQSYPIHPMFLSYSCLMATDGAAEEFKIPEQIEKATLFAMKRMRRTHEGLCTLALAESKFVYQSMTDNSIAESILPYMLHLLSYHPDFPESVTLDSELDQQKMRMVINSVKLILRVLNESVPYEADNISYLLKQLNMINYKYIDGFDPSNVGLHFVTRIAMKLLYEQIKVADHVMEYPGEIQLPDKLFRVRPDEPTKVVESKWGNSLLHDEVIDKALNRYSGRNISNRTVHAKIVPMRTSPSHRVLSGREDDGYEVDTTPLKVTKESKKVLKERSQAEDEATRKLPTRRAKISTHNYVEPEENEAEVEEWDHAKDSVDKNEKIKYGMKETKLSNSNQENLHANKVKKTKH